MLAFDFGTKFVVCIFSMIFASPITILTQHLYQHISIKLPKGGSWDNTIDVIGRIPYVNERLCCS